MDKIVNWLLLIIIFVFDPLAISLVIAANFAFSQLLPKKEYPLEEKIEEVKEVIDVPNFLEKKIEKQTEIKQSEIIDNEKDEEIIEDEKTIEDEETIEVVDDPIVPLKEYSPVTEEERPYDLDGDGVLNDYERKRYEGYKANANFFARENISEEDKQKMRDYLDGNRITYF